MKNKTHEELVEQIYDALDDTTRLAEVKKALEVLRQAPDDPESYLLMAEVAEESQLFDHALWWIDKGLDLHKDHVGLLLKKAAILIDGFEDIDEAFLLLLRIKKIFGLRSLSALKKEFGTQTLVEAHLLLADCFRLMGNFNLALSHAELAKKASPANQSALLALATAYFELGHYAKALRSIEPVDSKEDPADFFWLTAQILCAQGSFEQADQNFLAAHHLDPSRYHLPVRLDKKAFSRSFNQAISSLPRAIRQLIRTTSVTIHDVVPISMVKQSGGFLSPLACIAIEKVKGDDGEVQVISIFRKSIENLAADKKEIKDLIASALIHELVSLAVKE